MHNMPGKYRDVIDYNEYAYNELLKLDLENIDVAAKAMAYWEEAKKNFEKTYTIRPGEEYLRYITNVVDFSMEKRPNAKLVNCSFRDGDIIKRVTIEISGVRLSTNTNVDKLAVSLPFSVGVMNKSLMAAFESERYIFSLSRDIGAIGSAERFTLALLNKLGKTYSSAPFSE